MVHKIGFQACFFDVRRLHVSRQLIEDRADHLEMAEFLDSDIRQDAGKLRIRHGESLTEITHGGAEFSVRPSIL